MPIAIKRRLETLPGGMMLVPLAIGSVLHTLAPGTPHFFGSFTGALFTGALPILAVFYVCMGATIELRALSTVLGRGGSLLGAKIALGFVAGLVGGRLLGEQPVASGPLAGLSTLAVVAALNDTNGGLYMALLGQFGRAEEAAAYSVMSLESGPFLTMLSLGAAGLAAFPWQTLLGAVLPLLLGIVLGNLDREMRVFLSRAAPSLIPFFAFAIGCTLDLRQVWSAGLLGLALGVFVVVVSGAILLGVDRLAGGNGTAGLAAATTAANAAAVPALVAAAQPAYRAAAGPATVLVAASVIVTSLLTPLVTAWWARRVAPIPPPAPARPAPAAGATPPPPARC